MRKLLLIVSLLVVFSATPATAITDGELDGDGHPMVGIMVAKGIHPETKEFGPLWRCSGTLIGPRLFLTAGHCTEAPATSAEIWFDPMLEDNLDKSGYPYTGEVSGTTYTHPLYDPQRFWLHDLGVVVLDTPVQLRQYGELPYYDQIDELVFKKYPKTSGGKNKLSFTAVGYGLQKAFPDAAAWKDVAERIRMVSYPKLIQINVPGYTGSQSLILSNNTNTGGTCFGDSGGPNFIGDTLVVGGVTSFGKNGTCAGQGGVYRVDQKDDLRWLEGTFGRLIP